MGRPSDDTYQPHMTVGQCGSSQGREYLIQEAKLLPELFWEISSLVVLRRDLHGNMHPWRTINISNFELSLLQPLRLETLLKGPELLSPTIAHAAFRYLPEHDRWMNDAVAPTKPQNLLTDHVVIASYNVLADFGWPPFGDRRTLITRTLSESNAVADVLVLQNVTNDFLSVVLADKNLRELYPYVSHPPLVQADTETPPHHLKLTIMSKYQFSWKNLPSTQPRKATCLAIFNNLGVRGPSGDDKSFVVAAVNLAEGLTDDAAKARLVEMRSLLDHLSEQYDSSVWIVAGNFNIVSSTQTIAMARQEGIISGDALNTMRRFEVMLAERRLRDTWIMTRLEFGESSDDIQQRRDSGPVFEGEQGATFIPRQNNTPSHMAGNGAYQRPQRYDRILLMGDVVRSVGFNMFGTGNCDVNTPSPLSNIRMSGGNYYGIRCLLRAHGTLDDRDDVSTAKVVPVNARLATGALARPLALRNSLVQASIIPTTCEETSRDRAFSALEDAILDRIPGSYGRQMPGKPILVLIPVGSYGLGVWTKDSDIDCLCLGSMDPSTFFQVVRQRLRKSSTLGIHVLRTVNAASGKMLELEVQGVKVDLHYCQAPSIAEDWPDVMRRSSGDRALSLSFDVLAKLKPARDLAYLRRSIPDLAQYRLAHYTIKVWAKKRGIYGARFGYLGGIHISVLLVSICKTMALKAATTGSDPISAENIVTTFFDHYATFNWESRLVYDPFFHKHVNFRRTHRESLCLLGWHPPSLNTATTASRSTAMVLKTELGRARALLEKPGMTWLTFLGDRHESGDALPSGVLDFLNDHKHFVKLDIHYWGASLQGGARLLGWIEARCANILVDIGTKIKGLSTRIWPGRFTEPARPEQGCVPKTYEGFYLVGLAWDENGNSNSRQVQVLSNMLGVLQQLECRITSDEKYFDPRTSWFGASIVQATQLGLPSIDRRDWGPLVDEGGSDDDDGELVGELATNGTASLGAGMSSSPATRLPDPSNHVEPSVQVAQTNTGHKSRKMRTAVDVLNRLRWDPALDADDHTVGYIDRFDGIQEKAVKEWETEQTDEEFIPQHRIAYFRKKSTGDVVWDRARRIDLIFRHP